MRFVDQRAINDGILIWNTTNVDLIENGERVELIGVDLPAYSRGSISVCTFHCTHVKSYLTLLIISQHITLHTPKILLNSSNNFSASYITHT